MTSRSRQATVLTVEDELDRAFLRLVPGEAGGERERRHHLVMIEGLLHDGLSEEEVEHALDRANGWGPAGRPPTGRIRPLRRVFRGGRFPARRRG